MLLTQLCNAWGSEEAGWGARHSGEELQQCFLSHAWHPLSRCMPLQSSESKGVFNIEAEAAFARLGGATVITAIHVTHTMTRAAAFIFVFAADVRLSSAVCLRGAGSFLASALLAVIVWLGPGFTHCRV